VQFERRTEASASVRLLRPDTSEPAEQRRAACLRRRPGREGHRLRRTSFHHTCVRHRAGSACPRDCPVCGKQCISPPFLHGKSRMRTRARTDLRGGRSAMVVPTATLITKVLVDIKESCGRSSAARPSMCRTAPRPAGTGGPFLERFGAHGLGHERPSEPLFACTVFPGCCI
jgi:hypothetical protein